MRERPFPMRGRVAWGAIFALLLIVGIGGWSVTAKLSGAVIGTGTVLVDEDLKVVQHIEGGVVRDIAVRKGDTVAEGQLLLRLDDVQVRSELAIVRGQLAELTARRARLLAERDGAETLVFPAEYFADYADAELIADGERQLFDGNMHNHVSQKEQLALQVAQLHEEVNGLAFQKTAIMAELDVTLVDRERMMALAEERLVETSRISEIQRDVARLQGQQGEIEAAIARALSRTSEVELQILALDGALRTEAQRELRTVEAQIAELEERLGATEDRLARSRILAPVSGTVNELNVTTLGGVISPGEALVTIVPQDAELIIEFQVAVNDIDQIAVGRQAKLRFSAFNQRTTPELTGTIIQVSAAAQYNSQTGASYYLAQVEVNEAMEQLGGRELVPGMPVEIFVETEEQLAIAYFVKPFTDQIARAFREE
ncbi:HlyD family type I secretion periplasmic adaptor subunit [Devosia ginsengisoli]|uniref:Membrane fusion protein (MFP) family protein n=2 Tax=Devosia ginsengisoli TaxID=400770 RepID=A0A5B8LZM9_9HYPH|nr:HlyD family type I secretion periplasmic adaptor subunit [Devosia ginsengisoli]